MIESCNSQMYSAGQIVGLQRDKQERRYEYKYRESQYGDGYGSSRGRGGGRKEEKGSLLDPPRDRKWWGIGGHRPVVAGKLLYTPQLNIVVPRSTKTGT